MFRDGLLLIIRRIDSVYTAIGIVLRGFILYGYMTMHGQQNIKSALCSYYRKETAHGGWVMALWQRNADTRSGPWQGLNASHPKSFGQILRQF
jgi:hypothetical protein